MNKYSLKKTSFSIAMSAAFLIGSFGAHAQETEIQPPSAELVSDNQPAIESPAPVISSKITGKPSALSGLTKDQQAMVVDFREKNRELTELAHKEKILELQSSVERLKLDMAKSEQERKDVINGVKPATERDQADSRNQFNPFAQQMPQAPAAPSVAEKKVALPPLDRVYVTRIYGLDDDLRATVYFDNAVMQSRVGDSIGEGIKLTAIEGSRATFSLGNKSKKVSLTSGYTAFSNAFDSDSEHKSKTSGQSAPSMPGPMAIPMTPF